MYIDVLLELKNKQLDQTYTYKVPVFLEKEIKVGKRVRIPFNHRELEGYILSVKDSCEKNFEILEVLDVIDEEIVLNNELLKIGTFMKDTYLCSLSSAFAIMLPSALKASLKTNVNKKFETYLSMAIEYKKAISLCTSERQIDIVNGIKKAGFLQKSEANKISVSSVNTLLKKKIIIEQKEEVYRLQNKSREQDVKKVLNEEQKIAFDAIVENLKKHHKFLLHGVTGSGKTEIYMQVIEEVINRNQTAIVLVPEISLTPQFVSNFKARFQDNVAVLHSGLSQGEKYDEWRKITRKEVQIVIGARSAIFAPLNNLGIIIVDEEHSDSYKQENSPRYHAIEVAEFRAEINEIPLVLGSATPTLERMAKTTKNLYTRLELKNRVNKNLLPICISIDMAQEIKKGNSIISERLKTEIEASLSRQEQIILLLNRRGFATTITCSNCGFTYKCPNCDITLTYHKTNHSLRCHYCGYTTFKKENCPDCKENLNFYGLGTEKLEQIVKELFPDIKVLRMDADTTRKKNSYETIVEKFKSGEYNLLLGTQMISKGLDFPRVSLVGVINADESLNIPDFRSGEKTFSLLYQAAGRAGRKDTLGTVVLQTYNPNNPILKCVEEQSYEKFYMYEMNIRKKLKYPPYYFLVSLKITSKEYEECSKEATKVANYLKKKISDTSIVLGPTTANVFKVNNIYRFNIVVKYRFDDALFPVLKELDKLFVLNKKVSLEIDVNPVKI